MADSSKSTLRILVVHLLTAMEDPKPRPETASMTSTLPTETSEATSQALVKMSQTENASQVQTENGPIRGNNTHQEDEEPSNRMIIMFFNQTPSTTYESDPEEIQRRNARIRQNPDALVNIIGDLYHAREKQEGKLEVGRYTAWWTGSPVPFHLGFVIQLEDTSCHHFVSVRDRKTTHPVSVQYPVHRSRLTTSVRLRERPYSACRIVSSFTLCEPLLLTTRI